MLEAVQKYFVRRAFFRCKTKYVQYIYHLTYLNLQSLERRRLQLDLTMCFNIVKLFVACNLSGCFRPSSLVARHQNSKLLNCYSRLNVRKYFFANRVVNPWNALPANIAATNVENSTVILLPLMLKTQQWFYTIFVIPSIRGLIGFSFYCLFLILFIRQ